MICEEAIKLMDGYLDGELDPMTSQKIEQHLRDCPIGQLRHWFMNGANTLSTFLFGRRLRTKQELRKR